MLLVAALFMIGALAIYFLAFCCEGPDAGRTVDLSSLDFRPADDVLLRR